MRIINGEARWYDNDIETVGGTTARFVLPMGREDTCTDKRVGDRLVRRFRVRYSDCSAQEAKQYEYDLSKAPSRAMMLRDVKPTDRRFPGQTIETCYTINIQPGPRTTADWLIFDQHNSLPPPNSSAPYRSPPIGLNFKLHPDGIEYLHIEARTDTVKPDERWKTIEVADPIPFSRSPHRILRRHRLGADGLLSVEVDGVVIADYQGPLGYSDHAFACWSAGIYRSPWCLGKEEITIHFEDWSEIVI